jgi:microcystin-dependent protein
MEPYIGEIRLMPFDYAPRNWALCNGQLLAIAQNQALFSLLGTQYGGNGINTFALPDLRGRTPIHNAGGVLGQATGEEMHALTATEMPQHIHQLLASSADADQSSPGGNVLAAAQDRYHAASDLTTLAPAAVSATGSGAPHENRHPFQVMSWCIAIYGIFPSRD